MVRSFYFFGIFAPYSQGDWQQILNMLELAMNNILWLEYTSLL